MDLDSRWLVLVRDTTHRNPDAWVSLADLDSYINVTENAAIGDLETFTGIGSKGERTNIDADLTTLENMVGTYTPVGADLATDLDTVYKDVETEATGIKNRMPEYIDTFNVASAASCILTVADVPHEGDTVTIGAGATEVIYRARLDALSELGAKATCTLDLTADPPHDGDWVQLGLITYTFKTALTPTPGEVLIEATSADSALNLVAAVSGGAGAGTKYATGTSASPNITVAAVNDTMTVEYNTYGTLGNSFDLLTGNGVNPMTHGSFHQATLHGGVDPMADGDVFVNGSAENFIINLERAIEATDNQTENGAGKSYYLTTPTSRTDVSVTAKDASTMTLTALTKGSAGDKIEIVRDGEHFSWENDAVTLGEGTPGVNGEVGATGKVFFTADAVYFCTDGNKCVVSDSSGWKSAALS